MLLITSATARLVGVGQGAGLRGTKGGRQDGARRVRGTQQFGFVFVCEGFPVCSLRWRSFWNVFAGQNLHVNIRMNFKHHH